MKLVPYDVSKINKNLYAKTDNYRILTTFLESGLDCAKLEGWPQSSVSSCLSSLKSSIKRYRMGVDVISRKGEVFLIKRKYSSEKEEKES